jgi:hypothetical protein
VVINTVDANTGYTADVAMVALSANVQTPVTLQMQLCIATSAKPKTAPTAALTFTNNILHLVGNMERCLEDLFTRMIYLMTCQKGLSIYPLLLFVVITNCCECERSSYYDVTCVRLPLQVCCCVHIYLFSFPL